MTSKMKPIIDKSTPVVKRDINKWLAYIRSFLMLRDFTHNQRHEFEMAKRTQPQPLLPGGFAHKLNKNYYLDRDARRQVGQPQVVFSNTNDNQLLASSAAQPQLTAGGTAQQGATAGGTAQPSATAATSTPTNTSLFISIAEAEKQTAALLASVNNKQQKTLSQPRTPGQVYNWDG